MIETILFAVVALALGLALGWLLAEVLKIWAAFAIVFGVQLLAAALFGFLGYRKVRKIRKPERTIESLRESAQVLQHRGRPETVRTELGAGGSTTR